MKMKNTRLISLRNKGFTLVEMLVVIAIVGTLASIAVPVALRVFENAKKTQTKAFMKEFLANAQSYYKDNNTLTGTTVFGDGSDNAGLWSSRHGSGVATGNSFCLGDGFYWFHAMDGKTQYLSNSRVSSQYRGKQYFTCASAVDFKGGLLPEWNSSWGRIGMVDPWGYRYLMLVDYDLDGKFENSSAWMGAYQGQGIDFGGFHMGLYSPGPDGLLDGIDDVVSWE